MNRPFTPPETVAPRRWYTPAWARPERPSRPILVELDDGRTGLVIDAATRRRLMGFANGLALSGVLWLAVVAAIAIVRWAR